MNPVGKAIWFIESHFANDLTLDEIASIAGVSRYYMTRAFGDTTGLSIMRYVRGRRLSEAARLLANGAPNILALAIDSGYSSHEAFTRAFREQFGFTPEAIRKQENLNHIQLTEPLKMEEEPRTYISPPRFETGHVLLIAGIALRYTCETNAGIPAQWQQFLPLIPAIAGQTGRAAFGVRLNGDDEGNFDYLCGVEVEGFSRLSSGLNRLRIAPQKYAVFSHREHVSMIRSTWSTIWNKSLRIGPRTGRRARFRAVRRRV
jgi:AraC family transcriptional regulator